MPHPDFSEQSDPWDSFAREIGAEGAETDSSDGATVPEVETGTPEAETGTREAETVTSCPSTEADTSEAPPQSTEIDDSSSAGAADSELKTDDGEEPLAEEAGAAKADPEPEEGAVGWNFLAQELGIQEVGEAPVAQENPADKLFADYTPSYIEPETPSSETAEDVEPEDSGADGFGDGLGLESDTEEQPAKRPRRRGRRRSGRRRGSKTESEADSTESSIEDRSVEDEVSSEASDAVSEEKSGRRRRSRRRGRRGGKERSPEEEVEKTESNSGSEAESDSGAQEEADEKPKEPVKHRKIPTWGEAISVVVEANLASRSKQPASKPTKGRRGRSKSKR